MVKPRPVGGVRIAGGLCAAMLALAGCAGSGPGEQQAATRTSAPATLQVRSAAWPDAGTLQPPYGCRARGDHGRSPPVTWTHGPTGTRFYALTVVDVDADDFLHWAVLNLPESTTSLPAGSADTGNELDNDFGYTGYGAPCPPAGQSHHYVLTVRALRERVTGMAQLGPATLAKGSHTATYSR